VLNKNAGKPVERAEWEERRKKRDQKKTAINQHYSGGQNCGRYGLGGELNNHRETTQRDDLQGERRERLTVRRSLVKEGGYRNCRERGERTAREKGNRKQKGEVANQERKETVQSSRQEQEEPSRGPHKTSNRVLRIRWVKGGPSKSTEKPRPGRLKLESANTVWNEG